MKNAKGWLIFSIVILYVVSLAYFMLSVVSAIQGWWIGLVLDMFSCLIWLFLAIWKTVEFRRMKNAQKVLDFELKS